jgi:hypothetical protein
MDYRVGEMRSAKFVPERTSEIVARVARENQAETISVGQLVEALHDRSFGAIIILFALPNAIVPIAWVLGLPILLLAVQLVMGRQRPWLPEFMNRQTIGRETFDKISEYVVRYLNIMEKWLKPRWNWLTTDTAERIIGLWMAFLVLVLLVPVPFGNALPAFGISIIAAGLIEKDGAAIVVGSLIGLAGTFYVVALLGGILAAGRAIFGI